MRARFSAIFLQWEYELLLHQHRNYIFCIARLHVGFHIVPSTVSCYISAIRILLLSSCIILFLILRIYHGEVSRAATSIIKISIPFEDLASRYLTSIYSRPRSSVILSYSKCNFKQSRPHFPSPNLWSREYVMII